MIVLGVSCFYHDSAAALIGDGEILACVQEERFTRKKHDESFPVLSIEYCLKVAEITMDEVDTIIYYDKPFLKFERFIETFINYFPKGFSYFRKTAPVWLSEKLFQKDILLENLRMLGLKKKDEHKLLFNEHHLSHAASAFYPSPFEEALVLTIDGVGEWATASVCIGKGNELSLIRQMNFPHSLGLFYSTITAYLGFKVNSGEYKVMGLAPYGEPKYFHKLLDELFRLHPDGSFSLNEKYFQFVSLDRMWTDEMEDLIGFPPRPAEGLLGPEHMHLASSLQATLEKVLCHMVEKLHDEFQMENLCLAGGVALNCVANKKLLDLGLFKNIWIQPAAGDAGGALGAALYAYYQASENERKVNFEDSMKGAYLGPEFSPSEILNQLENAGAHFNKFTEDKLLDQVANDLKAGKAIGWMNGRMEFGPRALGSRSILADPRSPEMQKHLNLKIKFRESFRPFAPAILAEDVAEWFDFNKSSPYMLMVANIKKNRQISINNEQENLFGIEKLNTIRSELPAITHLDYSARLQTVHQETNPLFHKLLTKFKEKTGCPVLINTSFNVRGEPIVCTPSDAYRCFMGTNLDRLVIGPYYLKKEDQKDNFESNFHQSFEKD